MDQRLSLAEQDAVADRRSKLDTASIRAVLEAQRNKIASLQKEHRKREEKGHGAPGKDRKEVGDPSRLEQGGVVEVNTNPVYGADDLEMTPKAVYDMAEGVKRCIEEVAQASSPFHPVGDLFQTRRGEGVAKPSEKGKIELWGDIRSQKFLESCTGQGVSAPDLRVLPPQSHEAMLVEDLLFSFGGFQGQWVRMALKRDSMDRPYPELSLMCEVDIDPSIQEMVLRMVPLSRYAMIVRRFAETRRQYSFGLINQALAGAMRGMLLDWELMIAQIENQLRNGKGTFTLQALWYYIQSPMSAFQLVANLASDAATRRLKGASLLSHIYKLSKGVAGDPLASKFMARILRSTTDPYFAILEKWMCDAEIDDPYAEFVVQEKSNIGSKGLYSENASEYWSNKFTLKEENGVIDIPCFLADHVDEILNSGKCIDLIKSCDLIPDRPFAAGMRLEYDEEGKYASKIRNASRAAAAAAIHILNKQASVLHGLSGFRKYFLMAQGDLFQGFMDIGEIDLKSTNVPMTQLQDVLNLAVQSCSSDNDPVAQSLQIVYGSKSLHQMMLDLTKNTKLSSSLDSIPKLRPIHSASVSAAEKSKIPCRSLIMLYYKVPWPLVLVAPDAAIAQYQAFFKHLFDLKWVERELNQTAKIYQVTKSLANFERRSTRRLSLTDSNKASQVIRLESTAMRNLMIAYRTCQSMIHFFRQYLLYSSFELLDPLWRTLEERITDCLTVDEMISHHFTFLEKAMKGLFLSRKLKLPPALFKVEELALEFAKLSSKHLEIDYDALDRAAENSAQLDNLTGRKAYTEKKKYKSRRIRASVDAALTNPQYETKLMELTSHFNTRSKDFLSLLSEAYEEAKRSKHDSREDLECLSNLIDRLAFNGWMVSCG